MVTTRGETMWISTSAGMNMYFKHSKIIFIKRTNVWMIFLVINWQIIHKIRIAEISSLIKQFEPLNHLL